MQACAVSEAGRTAEVTFRHAEEADLPRLFEVFRAALNAYLVPAGQAGIPEGDDQSPAYRHYRRHDGERFWIAEAVLVFETAPGLLLASRPSAGWTATSPPATACSEHPPRPRRSRRTGLRDTVR